MLEKIKKILTDSCILFTVFVFILLIINNLFSSPSEGVVIGLSLETCALLFCCSVLLRAFHNILHVEKISLALRVVLNFVLVVGTAFAALKLIEAVTNRQSNDFVSLLMLSVFTLIYSGVIAASIIIKQKKAEKKKEKEEYKSIVKK